VKRKNVKNGGNSEKRKIDDSESDEEMDGEEEEATGLFDRVRVIEGEEEEATGLFDRVGVIEGEEEEATGLFDRVRVIEGLFTTDLLTGEHLTGELFAGVFSITKKNPF
jgi:hypothetical protein